MINRMLAQEKQGTKGAHLSSSLPEEEDLNVPE